MSAKWSIPIGLCKKKILRRIDATEASDIKSMFALGGLYNDLTLALNKPVELVATEALNHKSNLDRTVRFYSHIKEDERIIYEKEKEA